MGEWEVEGVGMGMEAEGLLLTSHISSPALRTSPQTSTRVLLDSIPQRLRYHQVHVIFA